MTVEKKDKAIQIILGIATTISMTIASASVKFAWDVNEDMAILKTEVVNIKKDMIKDESNRETANAVLKDWSMVIGSLDSHGRQLKSLWEHLNSAQEKEVIYVTTMAEMRAKINYCCD